jgi:ATP-dependent helicase/nuclease subunit A
VFIFGCASAGNSKGKVDLATYHEKFGLILDIPQAEELPIGGNYFRNVFREEEKAKDNAELKRLLYVAMTRAESRLFLTFTLPGQTTTEKKVWDSTGEEFNEELIRRRLSQLEESTEGKQETFLKLLLKVLPDCPPSLCTLEVIPVLSRDDISRRARRDADGGEGDFKAMVQRTSVSAQRKAALAAAPFYAEAEVLPEGKARPLSIAASRLGKSDDERAAFSQSERQSVQGPLSSSPLDELLEKNGISAMDFGSLVHAILESCFDTGGPDSARQEQLKGKPFLGILAKLEDEKSRESITAFAEDLADNFLTSDLGKRCIASPRRESEFPVVTSAVIDGRPIAITGKIDLLFIEENEVVVVDFKTDKTEKAEDHYAQLAVYCQAAGDIFGRTASAWLYYLRSGSALNATSH